MIGEQGGFGLVSLFKRSAWDHYDFRYRLCDEL